MKNVTFADSHDIASDNVSIVKTCENNALSPLETTTPSTCQQLEHDQCVFDCATTSFCRWWKKEEIQSFKEKAKKLSRYLRRYDNTKNSYKGTYPLCLAQKKTDLMIKEDFNSLLKLPLSRPDQDLKLWCMHDDGRRGLEKYICKVDALRIRDGVRKVRADVFAIQQQLQSQHDEEEKIAESSRNNSRRTRTLAHYMGEADALVAASYQEENLLSPKQKRRPPPPKTKIIKKIAEQKMTMKNSQTSNTIITVSKRCSGGVTRAA